MMMTMASRRTVRPASAARPRALAGAAAVSAVLAALVVGSAIAGLAVRDIYRGPDSVAALLRGYDLVTLAVAVPLLVAGLRWRTPRGSLLWAGALTYLVYTYAYYLFGTELNLLFVVHAAVFTLSVAALVLLLSGMDARRIAGGYGPRTPVRVTGGVLLVLGASLAAMWTIGVAQALAGDSVLAEPSQLVVPASVTRLGAALDLSLLVPGYLLAGVLLWRRAAWGYVAATALLVAGVLHQVAYMTALVFQTVHRIPGAAGFDPVEPLIVAAFSAGAAVLLWHCDRRSGGQVRRHPGDRPTAPPTGAERTDAGVVRRQR